MRSGLRQKKSFFQQNLKTNLIPTTPLHHKRIIEPWNKEGNVRYYRFSTKWDARDEVLENIYHQNRIYFIQKQI